MTTSFVTTEEFSVAVPLLPNDPAVDAGTLFLYDLLDPANWSSQAAPANNDVIADLSGADADATAKGTITWNSGFRVNPGSSVNNLLLPTESRLASDQAGFGIALVASMASNSALSGVMGIGDAGSYDTVQWGLYFPASGTALHVRWNSEAVITTFSPTVGQLYHMAITGVLNDGDYDVTFWVNGVSTATGTVAGPMVVPTVTQGRIGTILGVTGNAIDMTFRRVHANDLSARTAADFVAADLAARQEWFA